jgi:hypothetical protein
MRQVVVTIPTAGTTTDPVILDQYQAPFQVTYVNSGSGTVQVSATDPYPVTTGGTFTTATFTWVTAPTTAPNAAGFLAQPYRAMRINGGVAGDTLTVIQSGVKG